MGSGGGQGRGRRGGMCRRYGPRQTVYGLYRRWQCAGIWKQILAELQARADAVGLITWDVSVDSSIARAHQHAAGARKKGDLQKETPGGVECGSTDHPLGRSRGEWTTKLHLGCEPGQRPPLSILVTAGQRGAPRSPQSSRASGYRAGGRAGPTPDRVLADKAYSATRAVATRFDKLAVRYQATLHIAAINEWLYPTYETRPS